MRRPGTRIRLFLCIIRSPFCRKSLKNYIVCRKEDGHQLVVILHAVKRFYIYFFATDFSFVIKGEFYMICSLLEKAQQGDQAAMLELINRFQPLLKKYARKLGYDDAYEDCLLFFIELVKFMDLKKLNDRNDQAAVAYIKVSVKHFYDKRIRKVIEKNQEIAFSDLSKEQKYYVEAKTAKPDEKDIFIEFGMDKRLSPKEKLVIYLVYVKGYTTSELARKLLKSKQTVNQLKKRALGKLKDIDR